MTSHKGKNIYHKVFKYDGIDRTQKINLLPYHIELFELAAVFTVLKEYIFPNRLNLNLSKNQQSFSYYQKDQPRCLR